MKSIFLTLLFALLLTNTTQANNSIGENPQTKISKFQGLNTFCKMVSVGNLKAVKDLINSGTNVDRKSIGLTPAMYAARYNRAEILELLVEKGADLTTKSNRGLTALQYAEKSRAKECIAILKKALAKK